MSEFSKLLGDAIASIIEVKEESDIDSFLGGGQMSFLRGEIKIGRLYSIWPWLSDDIESEVESCLACQKLPN